MIQTDIECAVRSDANVLISGGDLVARTALARLIHDRSAGQRRSLIVLGGRRSVVPPGMVHAATASVADAVGGTLFIEELATLDHDAQNELMRLLDGGAELVTDRARETRIISGTAHDPKGLMAATLFNTELFYRLNVIHINLGAERRRPKPSRVH